MKKNLAVFFIFISVFAFSQVADDELRVDETGIVFENYTGTYRYTETILQIRAIGAALSNRLRRSENNRGVFFDKYSVIHCYDDSIDGRYNADIISIDPDARVDHIRNVRAIISSYLSSQYGYSIREGQTLAYFITIYNAVYRGNIDFFKSRYKDIVIENITPSNAGLSTRYSDWPGNTKIIIPLREGRRPDTFGIMEDNVIEQARSEDGRSVRERREAVRLQEKQIADEKKEIEYSRKEVAEAQKELTEAEKRASEKKEEITLTEREIAVKQTALEEEKRRLEGIREPEKKEAVAQEIEKKEVELGERRASLEQDKEAVKEQEKEIAEKKEELREAQKVIIEKEKEIEKKEERVSEAKVSIAADETEVQAEKRPEQAVRELEKKAEELSRQEQSLREKEQQLRTAETQLREGQTDPKILAGKFYYLKVNEYLKDGHYNNEVHIIDAGTRKLLKTSPYKGICGKDYIVFDEGVVVIGHKGEHEAQHFLIILDPDSLEIKHSGTDNIFFRSFIKVHDNHIFAVLKNGNDYFLGKFNLKMELVSKSDDMIFNDTFITFYGEYIYVNSRSRDILVLDKSSLLKVDLISR